MKVSIGRYPKSANKDRKISVKIDKWDTWSMDHTLALIIHPMLVQLRNTLHGSPFVDDEDVPEEIRSTAAKPKENEYDTDDFHEKRWEWVLDEMIWAFFQKIDDSAEDQFHSGKSDIRFERVVTDTGVEAWEMKEGPNHTAVFDKEGWEKWNERKQNGFKLFGKYYEALWD